MGTFRDTFTVALSDGLCPLLGSVCSTDRHGLNEALPTHVAGQEHLWWLFTNAPHPSKDYTFELLSDITGKLLNRDYKTAHLCWDDGIQDVARCFYGFLQRGGTSVFSAAEGGGQRTGRAGSAWLLRFTSKCAQSIF